MMGHRQESDHFDVVDLDPYGSASVFLDGAVQSIADGGTCTHAQTRPIPSSFLIPSPHLGFHRRSGCSGLLCVTCTDSAVLCGAAAENCFGKYGSYPLRSPSYCHEMV